MAYCKIVTLYLDEHPNISGLELYEAFKDTPHINSYRSARRYLRWWKQNRRSAVCTCGDADYNPAEKHKQKYEEKDGQAVAESDSSRIRTLDQLLEACQVDQSIWQVESHSLNSYEIGAKNAAKEIVIKPMYSVKARLSLRKTAPLELALENILSRIQAEAKALPPVRYKPVTGDYLLVPSLYDVHFGNQSVDGTHTVEQARAEFMAVVDAVVARAQSLAMPIEKVLFIAGNDALHADSLSGTTTKGTAVDLVGDLRDIADVLIDVYFYAVRRFAEIAPVDVIAIESNHDRLSGHMLGKVIEARFSDDPRVQVDASRGTRKYVQYGVTLLGLDHGDNVKPRELPALMAEEAKKMWAETTYREWLRGHIHHQQGLYYPLTTEYGVTTRVMPSLTPPDTWHDLHGFVGHNRAAEVLFYHKEQGPAGSFPIFVDELMVDT